MENEKYKHIVTAPDGVQYTCYEYEPAAVEELLKIRADMDAIREQPHTFAEFAQLTQRLAATARNLGGYYLAAPEGLLEAGNKYYREHAEQVRAALEQGGADAETVTAVLYDYGAALCGIMTPTATPQQMANALKSCPPVAAYDIDKYGFYLGLLYCYQRNINTLNEYTREVKQEPDATKRDLYFSAEVSAGEFTDLNAAALLWLQDIGYITASDFAGVDTSTIRGFLGFVDLFGHNGQFVQYVFTAKNALNATPEQLKQLQPPPLFANARISPIQAALNYADILGEEMAVYLARVAEQVEAANKTVQEQGEQSTTAPKPGTPEPEAAAGTTPEQGQAAAPVEVPDGIINEGNAAGVAVPVRIDIPENYALIKSRDVWAAAEQKGEPHPITVFIADLLRRNPQYSKIGTYAITRTIDAVNLLRQSPRATFNGDRYTIETNITEFANTALGFDANEQQKQELFTALMVLNDLYVIVWRKRGRVAVKLLTVREIGLDKQERGKLKIEVYNNALQGRPNLISPNEYQTMKKTVTGESKFHFLFQVIKGDNKKENALITEVFGYETKKADAEQADKAGTQGGQLEAVLEYERKNHARDRKYLLKWFEEWAAKGLITYKRYQNTAGEWVYRWKRIKPVTPEEKAIISAVRKKNNLPD